MSANLCGELGKLLLAVAAFMGTFAENLLLFPLFLLLARQYLTQYTQ